MKKPTDPVPLKERVTSRSTILAAIPSIASIVDFALPGAGFVGETAADFEANILLHVTSAVVFAIGYARDVAMAWIEAKAEAAGVNFEQAQKEAAGVDEARVEQIVRNVVDGPPPPLQPAHQYDISPPVQAATGTVRNDIPTYVPLADPQPVHTPSDAPQPVATPPTPARSAQQGDA